MTTVKSSEKAITFAVHDVKPADKKLDLWKARDGVSKLLLGYHPGEIPVPVQACSGYNSNTVADVYYHPLLAAVHLAFSDHRPLVLSADMIWITILHGLAQHIRNNPEKLRHRFVKHEGKQVIQVRRDDILPGSPENAWEEVVQDLSHHVRSAADTAIYDQMVCNFSTTGDIERTVSQVAILDAFQAYFEYIVLCVCGIPEITLEGTPADWQLLKSKLSVLENCELEWWLPQVHQIVDQFERASRGDIDLKHWQDIYKIKSAYGGYRMNGWIAKLIPYIKGAGSGDFVVPNPLLSPDHVWVDDEEHKGYFGGGGGITSDELPAGLSQVPFKLQCLGQTQSMYFIAGFVGIEQDDQTLALRPKLGWAVRPGNAVDQMMSEVPENCQVVKALPPPEIEAGLRRLIENRRFGFCGRLSAAFISFYKLCDGMTYTDKEGRLCRIRSINDLEIVEDKLLLRFCDLADGSYLAIAYGGIESVDIGDGNTITVHEPQDVICHVTDSSKRPVVLFTTFPEYLEDIAGRWRMQQSTCLN